MLQRRILDPADPDSGGTTSGGTAYNYHWEDWYDVERIFPKLTTLWHQGSPFNDQCPKKNKSDYFNGCAPAGCIAIAVAQIMAYHEFPDNPLANNNTWNWSQVKYIYSVGHLGTSGVQNYTKEDLAQFVRKIGDKCNMLYTAHWSFAFPKNAAKCLKEFGYTDAKKEFLGGNVQPNEVNQIVNMLRNDCPVFLAGCSNGNIFAGHAWVIDGYLLRQRDRYRNGGGEQNVFVGNEQQKFLHCNFGWGGGYNGYYVAGVFDPRHGADLLEPGAGDNSTNGNGNYYYDYNFNFYIINYTKPN